VSAASRPGERVAAGHVRALIIDDEALARRRLAAMLADEPTIQVIGEADGGPAAVRAIADQRPDLVFLDVQMPGLDGFGVLRCTAGAHRPVIIFVTAHDEHAIRAFEVHAADYLLKPIVSARLREAVRRAVERVRTASQSENTLHIERLLSEAEPNSPNAGRIAIKQPDGTVFVNAGDISWIEADGDHLRLHAARTVLVIRETLANFADALEPFGFVRVHRSAIVNPAAVTRVEPIAKGDYYLALRDGARVRSGRRYREVVRAFAGTDAR
jgi:two-component system, LytTR family, response regulator